MNKYLIVLENWSDFGAKEKVVKEFEAENLEAAQEIYSAYEKKHPLKSHQSYLLSERVS